MLVENNLPYHYIYQSGKDKELFSLTVNLTSLIAWGMKNKVKFMDNEGKYITSLQQVIQCIDDDCLIIQTDDEEYISKLQTSYLLLNEATQKSLH